MKFDVVLGNPPFQAGNQGLWQKFVTKSIDRLVDGGHMALVTPNSWANGANLGTKKNLFNTILQKNNTHNINMDVNSSFPMVGKNIGYWILCKKPYEGSTRVKNLNDECDINIADYPFFINVFSIIGLSIFQKVMKSGKFWTEFVEGPSKNQRELAFPKIRYNAGYRYGFKYDGKEKDYPTSPVVLSVDCTHLTYSEITSLYDCFQTSLYRFLWKIYGADDAGSFGWILRSMPKLDTSRSWTNQEIYKHFGLTQEEIDYVETTVK